MNKRKTTRDSLSTQMSKRSKLVRQNIIVFSCKNGSVSINGHTDSSSSSSRSRSSSSSSNSNSNDIERFNFSNSAYKSDRFSTTKIIDERKKIINNFAIICEDGKFECCLQLLYINVPFFDFLTDKKSFDELLSDGKLECDDFKIKSFELLFEIINGETIICSCENIVSNLIYIVNKWGSKNWRIYKTISDNIDNILENTNIIYNEYLQKYLDIKNNQSLISDEIVYINEFDVKIYKMPKIIRQYVICKDIDILNKIFNRKNFISVSEILELYTDKKLCDELIKSVVKKMSIVKLFTYDSVYSFTKIKKLIRIKYDLSKYRDNPYIFNLINDYLN